MDKSSSKHLVQSLDIHMDKKEDMYKKDEERSKSRGFWGVSNGK